MYIHVTVALFRIDNYINIYNQDGSKNGIKSDSNDVHAYMIIQNIHALQFCSQVRSTLPHFRMVGSL